MVKTKHVSREEAIVHDSNRSTINRIYEDTMKNSRCTLQAGVTIAETKSLIKKQGLKSHLNILKIIQILKDFLKNS